MPGLLGSAVTNVSPPPAASAPAALPLPAAATNAAAPLAPSATTNTVDALDGNHKLAIGDRLSFRILEDREADPKQPLEPKALFVTDSGDIEVPYIGRVPAENKTCVQLAREIKDELEKAYYRRATVILAVDQMTRSRGKVYLVGAVRGAGPQEIPSDEAFTLSKAILRAGSFSDYADKKSVRVTRKSGSGAAAKADQSFTVNVAEILEKGKTEFDITLEPGDFIYVPEKGIRF